MQAASDCKSSTTRRTAGGAALCEQQQERRARTPRWVTHSRRASSSNRHGEDRRINAAARPALPRAPDKVQHPLPPANSTLTDAAARPALPRAPDKVQHPLPPANSTLTDPQYCRPQAGLPETGDPPATSDVQVSWRRERKRAAFCGSLATVLNPRVGVSHFHKGVNVVAVAYVTVKLLRKVGYTVAACVSKWRYAR